MSRSIPLAAALLLATASLIMLIGLVAAGVAARASASPPARLALAPPSASAEPYCFGWDFLNNTGQDAQGVVLNLQGQQTFSAVYTETLNPFGAPDPSSGYDSGSDAYRLVFTAGVAYDSDAVHLGMCTDQPRLRLSTAAPQFEWIVSGTAVLPNPLLAGVEFNWLSRNQAEVTLVNEQAITLTLWSFNALDPDTPLDVNDLTGDIAALQPLVAEWITEPQTLAPNASLVVTLDAALAGHPYLVEAVLTPEDDDGNQAHLLAQVVSPPINVYLPLVMR